MTIRLPHLSNPDLNPKGLYSALLCDEDTDLEIDFESLAPPAPATLPMGPNSVVLVAF